MKKRARDLTPADCEGDAVLAVEIKSLLRVVADALVLRFKYLSCAPWSFASADTPEIANEFLQDVKSRPLSEHDPLTQYLFEMYEDDLVRVSEGGEGGEAFKQEILSINETPLDESAGEGYHRSTHYARIRVAASKSPFIKQSVRRKEALSMLKYFVNHLGSAGKRVLRWEWRTWRRILQTKRNRLWRNTGRMSAQEVYERVYRMDQAAEVDWSLICAPIRGPGQGPPPKEKVTTSVRELEALRIEYLEAVLKPSCFYSLDVPVASMDEEGRPVEQIERNFFQLVSKTFGNSRPFIMPTIYSHEEVALRSRLALNIQEFSVSVEHAASPHSPILYEDRDTSWIDWKDLGPWLSVRQSLQHFARAQASSEHSCCIVLADPSPAAPDMALTDSKCPVLYIMLELHKRGWKSLYERVVHDEPIVSFMDGREAVRMRCYYQVLLDIAKHLPLTTHIPSDEPIAFYKLLMRGVEVQPGLGAKAYNALMNKPAEEMPAVQDGDEDIRAITIFNY